MKPLLALAAVFALLPSTSDAKIEEKILKTTTPVIQTIQVKIDGLADCAIPAGDQSATEWLEKTGLKADELCLIDLKGYENKAEFLFSSLVNGKEVVPYVGLREDFKGRLVYFKNTLPSEGSLSFELKILGEKRGSFKKPSKAKQKVAIADQIEKS